MKKAFYLFALAIFSFTACKKDVQSVSNKELRSILLGKDTLTMTVGEVRQISFKTTPSDYDTTSLKWSSSDTTVISVTHLGKITALKVGTSKITVNNQVNTVSISCLVTVVPVIYNLKLGLIAYYSFNNSAVDSSGNGYNGTVYNAASTSDRFGKPNSAYYFNGANSYIVIKDNQPLRLSNTDFTLNSWVNLDQYSGGTGSFIMSKRTGSTNNDGWGYSVTGNGYISGPGLAYFGDGGTDPFATSKSLTGISKWVMITTVYSFNKQEVKIYLNGALESTTANIPPPNSSIVSDLDIGRDNINAPTSGYFLQGKIDDIRIYNRVLSSAEIQKLYTLSY
ncbi:MAG: hypothetical protein JWR02_1396 [Mucilaginibacter sp.]|nr:hypothetical protein [Mucilaginibacter sp.]